MDPLIFLTDQHPILLAWAPIFLILAFALGILPSFNRNKSWQRVLVVSGTLLIALRYYVWRISGLTAANGDGVSGLLAWTVFAMEALALLEALIAMLMLSRTVDRSGEADEAESVLISSNTYPQVDVFIPTYNEGKEVLEKTILGALALDWPKDRFTVCVLDDGRRDWLQSYCLEKGANYLTRQDNSHAKAGNINAAITKTTGEFIAVFDADFVPRTNFLKRTIGLFSNQKIGCVQTPHHFYNSDPVQANLLMNGILPDDQRMFFDVVMPSRDAWDAAFCCGSCGVLRRAAIDAIGGGIPTSSVTEDILTTLAMKRGGYITRFLNEKLAFGLAAESVEAFFVQRERWARGGIQLMFLKEGPFGPGLSLLDRLFFMPASWIIQYTMRIFGFVLPAFCLWSGLSPMPGAGSLEIISHQFPFLLAFFVMMRWLAPGHHIPLMTTASQCFASFRLAPSVIASLIKPFGVPFRVTPKGKAATGSNLDRRTFTFAAVFLGATITGLLLSIGFSSAHSVFPIVAAWSFWNAMILGIVMVICFETPRRRAEERFPANEQILVAAPDGKTWAATALDFSLSGGRALMANIDGPAEGSFIHVDISGVGSVPAKVVSRQSMWLRFTLDWSEDEMRDRMIVKLFASGMHEAGFRGAPVSAILKAAWDRLFGKTWLEAETPAAPSTRVKRRRLVARSQDAAWVPLNGDIIRGTEIGHARVIVDK